MKMPDSSKETRIALTPGEVFGALTVIEFNVTSSRRKSSAQYRLQCVCGRLLQVPMQALLNGSIVSCGCCNMESAAATHSLARLRTLWEMMVAGCDDETDADFPKVGARGIKYCEEWRDFSTFATWAEAQRYHDKLWVVRIDLASDFSPANCRFVMGDNYHRYQLLSRMVTAWGESKSVLEWLNDSRCTATMTTLPRRLAQGWSSEKAIITPHKIRDRRGFHRYTCSQIPIGARFGRQVVIGDYERIVYPSGSSAYKYPCRCDCGTPIRLVGSSGLLSGESQSCGCLRRELASVRARTHGATVLQKSRLYSIWTAIKAHCMNVSVIQYRHYGGKGIKVYTEWQRDFVAFRDWAMASGYKEDWYLTRHDERVDYSPVNCYWAPTKKKHRSVARVRYAAFGEVKSLAEWSQDTRCVVKLKSLIARVGLGWLFEKALTTPAAKRGEEYPLTVWETAKSLAAWTKDPRCAVSITVLMRRLDAGWTPEEALTIQPYKLPRKSRLYTAFGEEKTLLAWLDDSRSVVSLHTVQRRIELGWDLERSLTTPAVKSNSRFITAFGETKHIAAWSADARCCITKSTLSERLLNNWDPERAISTPATPYRGGRPPSPDALINRIAVGERFHHLTVIGPPEVTRSADGKRLTKFLCRCDCGNETTVLGYSMTSGNVKSCGCLHRAIIQERRTYPAGTPHGIPSPLYTRWMNMRLICQNPKHCSYPNNGGRGISVCDAWQHYDTFRTWALEAGYQDKFTLVRKDLDADFTPENCVWVEKGRNTKLRILEQRNPGKNK